MKIIKITSLILGLILVGYLQGQEEVLEFDELGAVEIPEETRLELLEFMKRQMAWEVARQRREKQKRATSDAAVRSTGAEAEKELIITMRIPWVALTSGDLIELKKAIDYVKNAQQLQLTRNAQMVFDTIIEQAAKINKTGIERRARGDEDIWEPETLEFFNNAFALIKELSTPVEQERGVQRQMKYADEEVFKQELATLES